jgi:hypothetical protein
MHLNRYLLLLLALSQPQCNEERSAADARAGDSHGVADGPGPARDGSGDAPADGPAIVDADPSLSTFERTLVDLPADSWFEAPGTKMKDVCAPASFGVNGVQGCKAIIGAWGGGAWDPVHRKMLIWGGGHNDYWGNEVYAFDLTTGKWERLTDPSPGPFNKDPLDDGNPVSRHTYDGLTYIVHADRFFGQAGSRATDGGGTSLTWTFDVGALTWTNRAPDPAGPGGYTLAASYDPSSRLVLARSPKDLRSYDYDTNTWSMLKGFGFAPLWPRYEVYGNKTSTVDSSRGLFWSVGSGDILIWDIAGQKLVTDDWKTTGGGSYSNANRVGNHKDQLFESGGGEIYDASAPGLAYDSKADQVVAWKGGGPWVLDLASKTWSQGSATGAPAAQPKNGTYGRFAYLARYNVFILVNSVDADVVFYKNSSGGPP